MSERIVKDAPRKTRRDIKSPLSEDFNKYLAEIVLNADDSYKRLEAGHRPKTPREITIILDRKNREISVIDRAEGMSAEEMEDKFSVYGADHAGGSDYRDVRGIFGQGASDVLFSCAMSGVKSEIKSIKEDKLHTCKFFFKRERTIRAQTQKRSAVKPFREKYGIPENGTVVIYGIPDEVKIPKKKTIVDQIESFYMFRYILSDKRRTVILFDDGKKSVLSSREHMFDRMEPVVEDKPFTFEYEGKPIEGSISLYYNKNKSHDGTDVIIKDERNAVYDNTLFGFEKYPGAHLVSGECIIEGLYHILKRKLEDPKNPLMILTDSRDGFDRRNNFTKRFFEQAGAIVKATITHVNRKHQYERISLQNNPQLRDLTKRVNDFYKERLAGEIGALNPGIEPPADGLAFAREAISVTEGKRYGLHLYINTNVIPDGTVINLSHEETLDFSVQPRTLSVNAEESDEKGLLSKTVRIDATSPSDKAVRLNAGTDDIQCGVDIRVVKEEVVYPRYGLEFIPANYRFSYNKGNTLKLYYDFEKYPPGTTVHVIFTSQQELLPREKMYTLNASEHINETTGLLEIPFRSPGHTIHYTVTAKAGDYQTKARIKVEPPQEKDKGKSGFLSRLELIFEDTPWQTSFDTATGTMFINGDHPINRTILGNLHDKDKKKPVFSTSQLRYIFELIAAESAKHMAINTFKETDIDSVERLTDFIQREKTSLYSHLLDIL